MFISRKKFDEALRKVREDTMDGIYERQDREKLWAELFDLKVRIKKLEDGEK